MPRLEAIEYVDQSGVQQVIEPKKMGFWERVRTDALFPITRLLTEIIYPNPHQAESMKTELWLFSYFPRERVSEYLAWVKSTGLRVRSTREIQIARTLAGRRHNPCHELSMDRIARGEPAVALQYADGGIAGFLFPRAITEPVAP